MIHAVVLTDAGVWEPQAGRHTQVKEAIFLAMIQANGRKYSRKEKCTVVICPDTKEENCPTLAEV